MALIDLAFVTSVTAQIRAVRTLIEHRILQNPEAAARIAEAGPEAYSAAIATILRTVYGGDYCAIQHNDGIHWFNLLDTNDRSIYVDVTGDAIEKPPVQLGLLPFYPNTMVMPPETMPTEFIELAVECADWMALYQAKQCLQDKVMDRRKQGGNPLWKAAPWIAAISAELGRAYSKHPRQQASLHEGFAVLEAEVDELWKAVTEQDNADRDRSVQDEAIRVAAMAIRLLIDNFGDGRSPSQEKRSLSTEERARIIADMLAEIYASLGEVATLIPEAKLQRMRNFIFRAQHNLDEIFNLGII